MKILISNDDGVHAEGIKALYEALSVNYQCDVVAPDRDRSGSSSALTLDSPLYPRTLDNGFISVDGTPCDCVHLALNGLLGNKPNLVVSGINLGANLGDDVMYSGTVAAALEGRFLELPSVAISLVAHQSTNLQTAVYFAQKIINQISKLKVPNRTVINVNVPDLPLSQIKGICLTRLGHRGQSNYLTKVCNPRGKTGFWISAAPDALDCSEGTDFYAIKNGFVAITPLRFDRTCYESEENLNNWLLGL